MPGLWLGDVPAVGQSGRKKQQQQQTTALDLDLGFSVSGGWGLSGGHRQQLAGRVFPHFSGVWVRERGGDV